MNQNDFAQLRALQERKAAIVVEGRPWGVYLCLNGFALAVGMHNGQWMIVWRSDNPALKTADDIDTQITLLQEAKRRMQGGA